MGTGSTTQATNGPRHSALAASPIPDNVYFAALEHGTTCMDGISYNEMVQYLKDAGKGWKDNLHESFRFWFFLNFYHEGATLAASRRLHAVPGTHYMKIEAEELNAPAILMGDAYMRYVDILELREARRASQIAETHAKTSIENSIEASTSAKTAFRLALVSFIASIVLSVVQIITSADDSSVRLQEIQSTVRSGFDATSSRSDQLREAVEEVHVVLDTISERSKTVSKQTPAPTKKKVPTNN